MKFSLAAIASFVAAVAASNNTLPAKFTLVGDGSTVVTANDGFFLSAKASTSPVASLEGGVLYAQGIGYTAPDETPTGWQNLYVIQSDVQPISMTAPHSGALPAGGNASAWGISDDGLLTFGGVATNFGQDVETGELYYLGLPHSKFQQVLLTVMTSI